MLCYRCGSHVPDSAERCETCGQRQVGTARMPAATGLRRKLNPALLAGAPYREGDVMAGRYLIKDAVGVGPLGFVLRATDRELSIDVSVKLIHPRFVQTGEERESFGRALDAARRFLHPSLTRLHDVGNDQGWPYVTYTFLDGLALRRIIDSRLAKGQTFALDEVEPILGQLMSALEAAHPAGAHGDLKAENILVLPDMLKVTDWGVAAGVPRPPFVQAQRQKAAHRHFAPEVLAGLALDPRADVYSLGVLVGEMLTGLTPEDEIPELRLVNPELPDAVEGFYRRALSERPESRFRSVREMFEAFAEVAEGRSAVSRPDAVDEVTDDGFEVVDFVETQTVVTQPEPLAVVAPPPPPEPTPAPEPPVQTELLSPPPVVDEMPTDVPAPPEPEAEPPQPGDDEPLVAVPGAAGGTEFWAENAEPAPAPATPPAVAAPEPERSSILWSDTDDEVEPVPAAPEEAAPPAPALSMSAPAPEPPAPPVESVPEAAPELAPPPPPRPLPGVSPAVPRIAERPSLVVPSVPPAVPAHVATSPRPVVPSVGVWGPGARRTGAHAAVAAVAAVAEEPLADQPLAARRTEVSALRPGPESPPVRPLSTPAPAVPRIGERPSLVPAPAARRPVDLPPPLTAVSPPAEEAPSATAHQGGLWSPGAALAELVSEVQAEEARGLATADGTVSTGHAELAARAVAEQRPARERLALMSATDEPTAPAPVVSGRPRKVAPAPDPVRAHKRELLRDQWLRRALVVAIFFAIGMFGAVMLLRAH